MRFEWDTGKSDETGRARGIDFRFAALIFNAPVIELQDVRVDYGERRMIAIGVADGRHLVVVYTDRVNRDGPVRRIISARPANRKERALYAQAYP